MGRSLVFKVAPKELLFLKPMDNSKEPTARYAQIKAIDIKDPVVNPRKAKRIKMLYLGSFHHKD